MPLTTKVFRDTIPTHDLTQCDGLTYNVNAFLGTLDPKKVRDVRYCDTALDNGNRLLLLCSVLYET